MVVPTPVSWMYNVSFPCTYSISPTSKSFASSGCSYIVSVTASSGCSWTASESLSWITITSGSSGSGNGTVTYSVLSNSTTSSRTGTMTIAGKTFTVTQSGISCTYSISTTSKSFTSSGGSASVSVTTQSGCSWTGTSNYSWIMITSGSSGSGSGTVYYSVSSNSSTSSRTGTMTIAGKTFTVTQPHVEPTQWTLMGDCESMQCTQEVWVDGAYVGSVGYGSGNLEFGTYSGSHLVGVYSECNGTVSPVACTEVSSGQIVQTYLDSASSGRILVDGIEQSASSSQCN